MLVPKRVLSRIGKGPERRSVVIGGPAPSVNGAGWHVTGDQGPDFPERPSGHALGGCRRRQGSSDSPPRRPRARRGDAPGVARASLGDAEEAGDSSSPDQDWADVLSAALLCQSFRHVSPRAWACHADAPADSPRLSRADSLLVRRADRGSLVVGERLGIPPRFRDRGSRSVRHRPAQQAGPSRKPEETHSAVPFGDTNPSRDDPGFKG